MRKKLDDLLAITPTVSNWWTGPGARRTAGAFAYFADDLFAAQKRIVAEAYLGTAGPLIILDGLLGVGARPPLREPIRCACRAINQLRTRNGAFVFAVDLPTGLDSDEGKPDRDCVIADFTVTIGFAKSGLLADDALNFVGRLELVQLEELRAPGKKSKEIIATAGAFRGLLPRRPYSSYKNQYGRIAVVAGSKGFVGAALMTTQGALYAGSGLVEVFVPEEIYEIVTSAAPMEAMVKPITSYRELLKEKPDVWALGPGLGKSRADEILQLIEKARQPMVVDADGLNILSEKTAALRQSKANGYSRLTRAMKRIFPVGKGSRPKIAATFCRRFAVTLC
jgi:NAD(P)H-hydrate epimerase